MYNFLSSFGVSLFYSVGEFPFLALEWQLDMMDRWSTAVKLEINGRLQKATCHVSVKF